ncbi:MULTISPECIES: DNA polymerase III subunit delta' [Marinobacter]|jgi:DNA polymerase-3 subunit delta'|uniref:DNA polymerase III subunit delta' n=1 Tax=Marinobacter TaxID=2742 RepID=UPI000C4F3127|nr:MULTISPECIES: DNA polymerase III subunit delta' [Marinobacter]MAO12301.1 DNA polymerase III subunit delta' [Marinobacter sp.]MDX5328925.1 DNA polymerase III subunit delta' [Marinobacter sp.]WBU43098.1 DNA polymerase III subunit delta' [Marinobacter alkaliphilus]BEH14521.1 DNA polymerase III subunit delta' [Marinobacter shengliensis]
MTDIAQEMPWLARAWSAVQSRLAQDRLPHALLVVGERGVGKRAWAQAVAGLLLCEAPAKSESGAAVACGHCKQCELMAAGSHPDLRVYAPEKSRMVKVDQIRALSTFAVASPQVGHHKVAIVDRADQLNINAANALLKTLEEPLPDVTLLLLQESGRPVLPTIRSRCQALTIPLPTAEQGGQWLAARVAELDEAGRPGAETLAKSLMLAGNAPRLALDYALGDFLPLRDKAFEAFRQFMKGQIPVGEAAKSFKALGLDDSLWLFESWAADLARASVGGAVSDPEAADMLGYLANNNPPWRAHQLLDLVRESRSAAVYNASPELEASQLLIAWRELMPRKRKAS